jgi:hypothetical protein
MSTLSEELSEILTGLMFATVEERFNQRAK